MFNHKTQKINKNIPIPYYYQLENIIKDKIEAGELEKGMMFPSEKELCKIFNISRVTLRKAITNLVSKGILKKKPGQGTVVVMNPRHGRLLDQSFSFYGFLKGKNLDVITKVLEFNKITPTKNIINILQLQNDEKIFKIKRLRIVKNEPLYYVDSYFPVRYYPNLTAEDLINNSFYKFMLNQIGIDIYGMKRRLYPKAANAVDAKILNIDIGKPVQIFENLNYTKDKRHVEYSKNVIRAGEAIFEIEITKEGLLNIGHSIL